jgi:hypothetical protein
LHMHPILMDFLWRRAGWCSSSVLLKLANI